MKKPEFVHSQQKPKLEGGFINEHVNEDVEILENVKNKKIKKLVNETNVNKKDSDFII